MGSTTSIDVDSITGFVTLDDIVPFPSFSYSYKEVYYFSDYYVDIGVSYDNGLFKFKV